MAAATRWQQDEATQAIAARRRDSNSFKHMSTGGLVSNSPFARRLGQVAPHATPTTVRAPSPVERRSSGSKRTTSTQRKVSAEDGPIKENESPHEVTVKRKASIEAAKPVPFRPTRGHHATSSSIGSTSMMAAEIGMPLHSQRPVSLPSTSATFATYVRQDSDSPLGLGSRPQAHPLFARRTGGASDASPSASPISAMSPTRRTDAIAQADDSPVRVLRHKASTKTVTWAATEEVLEYEPDEGRRSSNVSEASTRSAQTDDSEEADRSITFDEADNSGFTEGGSIEVHDWPRVARTPSSSDEPSSDVDTNGTTVEDMMTEIESYMSHDMLSPPMPSNSSETWGMAALHGYSDGAPGKLVIGPQRTTSQYASQARQNGSAKQDKDDEDVLSCSAYDDDEAPSDPQAEALKRAFLIAQSHAPRPLPSAPSKLAPAFALKPDSGPFALPELPKNSPLLKNCDDGTASSVVTVDLNEPVTPKATVASPLVPASHGLSRQASLIGSEVSTSSTGSLRNSRLLIQRARLEEALRQDALLTPTSSVLSPDLRRFPDPPKDRHLLRTSLTDDLRSAAYQVRTHLETVSRSPSSQGVTALADPPREIQARPALRPRGATISDQMLSNLTSLAISTASDSGEIVGSPLTPDMAESLQSPLERLSAQSKSELERNAISGAPPPRASVAALSDVDTASVVDEPASLRPRSAASRRRSLSTGDASVSETTSKPFVARKPVAQLEPAAHLDVPISLSQRDLELNLEKTFEHIIENGDRPYRLRESRETVYAYDGDVPTLRAAGGLSPSGWHKKRRPSDLRMSVARNDEAHDSTDRFAGRVFVTLIEARFDRLQLASRVTKGECFISCGGTSIRAGSFAVAQTIPIRKEFELVVRENLTFTVQIRIPIDSTVNTHLLPITPSPPPSPTKRMFKSVFSSPKKRAAPPTRQQPVPERLLQNLSPDGMLASSEIVWKKIIPDKPCAVTRIEQSLSSNALAPQPVSGTLVFEVYHIPVIEGLAKNAYPLSVAEAKAGFALAQQQSVQHFEGVLTQLGGDCSTWRRRYFKLVGNRLVPYSEVTRKAHVEIELALATTIEDPDDKQADSTATAIKRSSSEDMEESLWRVENMFRIIFKDGSHINFYADRADDKAAWLKHLSAIVGSAGAPASTLKAEPEWAKLLLKQMQVQQTNTTTQ